MKEEKLEEAKRLYETANADQKYVLESLFPELKEINEEEIKKAMINFFKSERKEGDVVLHYGVNIESMIAWLEKQDPKKHEEELEKAYKTADEVQYRRGYEDATKEMEKQGETYTKRDVDNAYIEGMASAKRELEKQAQKPAWSEEDKLVVEDIEEAVINYWHGQSQEDLLDWLKALKQRIGG